MVVIYLIYTIRFQLMLRRKFEVHRLCMKVMSVILIKLPSRNGFGVFYNKKPDRLRLGN